MANILGRHTINEYEILELDDKPEILGTESPIGSLGLYNGDIFLKYGINNNEWKKIITSSNNTNTVFNFPSFDGSINQVLSANPTGQLNWVDNIGITNGANSVYYFDDFINSNTSSMEYFLTSSSGTGSSVAFNSTNINSLNNNIGVLRLNTGTSSTGRAGIGFANDQLLLGYTTIDISFKAKIDSLPDNTNRFNIILGLNDNYNSSSDVADGVYFSLVNNTGLLRYGLANNSTRFNIDSSTIINTNYNIYRINISTILNKADFYFNNILIGTIENPIIGFPVTNTRWTTPSVKIQKVSGTTTRFLELDWFKVIFNWTFSRG